MPNLGKIIADQIAKDILSVQPMNTPEIREALQTLMAQPHVSEKEMREEGWKPVCESTRLMWIKDDNIKDTCTH